MAESFKQRLSKTGQGVLDERAANIAEMTKIEATNTVSQYRTKVLRLKNQIANHQDMAVESTHSLRPGSKEYDPKVWVDEELELQKQLRVAKIEYKLVDEWYKELFPAEEEDEDLTKGVED